MTANLTLGTAALPSFGNAPTGTVSFYSNGTLVGTPQTVTGTAGSGNLFSGAYTLATAAAALTTTALPNGQDNITAIYNGDSRTMPCRLHQQLWSLVLVGRRTSLIALDRARHCHRDLARRKWHSKSQPDSGCGLQWDGHFHVCVQQFARARRFALRERLPAGQTTGSMTVTTTCSAREDAGQSPGVLPGAVGRNPAGRSFCDRDSTETTGGAVPCRAGRAWFVVPDSGLRWWRRR